MDDSDRKIISLLGRDARRSLADIGAAVGLSASAVNDRIRRLTASGAIRRTTVDADPAAFGLPVLAFVLVGLAQEADEAAFRRYARDHGAIAECHHVTGAWSYLVKVRVASLADLEAFLAELKGHGFLARSETVIALSSVVAGPFAPADGEG
ncbi:Lrp/AsnC family transcriptional regulator [Kaustia mangrovi]|uniref:Lrp/AsnC family transcriptional regulator n=1 Tax=Kaustia mangrovi TaxID=2593653 RepID=A0A7S8C2J9_9HYPH|nr:Lrp/AsnC family transcriptional regulator [Kaustia mangrovi]QPC42220.1 Lrp/AsnC family transcriptional regulator [Kaustia mangrovi]